MELESSPPQELPVTLVPGERLTLTLEKDGQDLTKRSQRQAIGYTPCPTSGHVQEEMVVGSY